MVTTLLAKSLVDLSFGGAFAWYLVKFLISLVIALGGIMLGIKLRKSKFWNVSWQIRIKRHIYGNRKKISCKGPARWA